MGRHYAYAPFRNTVFLPQMAEVKRRCRHYVTLEKKVVGEKVRHYEHVDNFTWGSGDDTALDRDLLGHLGGHLNMDLMRPCEKPMILVVRDETIARQFDCHKSFWGTEYMRMLLRKTDGRGLMFSGFLTEEVEIPVPLAEQLARVNERRVATGKTAADRYCCLMQVDYSTEGWWNCDKMVEQTDAVIDVLEEMFPCKQFAFQFDWSSGHHRFPADALIQKHMNRGPGGRQPLMRPTTILQAEDAPLLVVGASQHMVFQEGDAILATEEPAPVGKAKGAEQVLCQQDLSKPGMSLTGGKNKDEEKSMVAALEKCLDFQGAKSLLEEMIEGRSHVCVFGAKFHCECSAIELLWGRGKLEARCDFSLEGLRRNSLQAFLDVPLLTIRRFSGSPETTCGPIVKDT